MYILGAAEGIPSQERRRRRRQRQRRTALRTTTCPALTSIPKNFLSAIKNAQTNLFYPTAYFGGSAVRFISANGLKSFFHPMICVDGQTTATTITLRDDGQQGDDVANDNIYTRACVHFCASAVNYADVFNYAFHQVFASADLIVVRPGLSGKIPYHVIQSPKYPQATVYATSHAAFFVDDQRHYMPGWPNDYVSG